MSRQADIKSAQQAEAASRVCLACGACCRGLLHSFAYMQEDDFELAADLELRVVEVDGGRGFRLPCHHLGEDNACMTYERRPTACPTYRCGILQEVDNDEISADEAVAYVELVVDTERKLYQHIGPRNPAKTIWHQFSNYTDEEQARVGREAFLADNARSLLDLKTLTVLCHRLQPSNFKNAPRPGTK